MKLRAWLTGGMLAALVVSGCGGDDGGGEAAAAADGSIAIEAGDLYFDPESITAEAGEIEFTLENTGGVEHDLVIEEAGDEQVVHADPGETATGSITLEAGTYTYYCQVPGHRTSMEGTLEVS